MNLLNRRATLRLGIPATAAVLGVQRVSAEPIDGKGNDVCPCFFDIDAAELNDDDTISVSGPCAVANPPEAVTVHVQVRGDRGARPTGRTTFTCECGEPTEAREVFTVAARIRGTNRFTPGETVQVHAAVHITPESTPAISGRWTWSGALT
jgi:hypothetical protein